MEKDSIPRLAIRAREAAQALGISSGTLRALTAPRGPIPCVKQGAGNRSGLVLYRVSDLEEWLRHSVSESRERTADGQPD